MGGGKAKINKGLTDIVKPLKPAHTNSKGSGLDKYINEDDKYSTTTYSPDYNVRLKIIYEDGEPRDTVYMGDGWNFIHSGDHSNGLYVGYLLMMNDEPNEEAQTFWNDLTSHFNNLSKQYKNYSLPQKVLYNLKQFFGILGSKHVNVPENIRKR